MPTPASGKYLIINLVDPQPTIGADNIDSSAVKPVIVDGEMRVWSLDSVGASLYKLVLEDNWYAGADGENVVVQTSVDPGTRWVLQDVGDGWYIIKSTNANTAWSASEIEPKSAVVLQSLSSNIDPYQKWKFVPIFED